ncbi:MAG: 4-alpha-glucanotransferase [Chloroflexi bacterium]|nr:4-alpha-glucanotransferase [Chloroflexota bacterium]
MRFPRSCGILLHPTSFPGRYGIGDLGDAAYQFADFLATGGQTLWQVMPLGPTGYGDSPYQCFSAFAGNPLLVSPDRLLAEGLLTDADLAEVPPFPAQRVDYGWVIQWKMALLHRSFLVFQDRATPAQLDGLWLFSQRNAGWLDDYALFMALKEHHGGGTWTAWEFPLVTRDPATLAHWREQLADAIQEQRYRQWLFFRQWWALKSYANERGIRFVGDIPIFVAHDSADVWANPHLFYLDRAGNPTAVAGVPPDYFSATGQLWGNPLYRWDVLARNGYDWWLARFRAVLELVDIIRLDHFRGFEAYWEIPAGSPTAEIGQWVKGPGAALFYRLKDMLGELPIVAEDLGVITREVVNLRNEFNFPGMKILQFAFSSDASNPFLPHNYDANCAVYTGTHDNDTSVGWFQSSSTPGERALALQYLGRETGDHINWDLIRLAYASVADTAVVPLQDVLGDGSSARMNYPSRLGGQWEWRYPEGVLTNELAQRLLGLAQTYGRAPAPAGAGPGGFEGRVNPAPTIQ